jgi:peptide/nickel transport system permease protein
MMAATPVNAAGRASASVRSPLGSTFLRASSQRRARLGLFLVGIVAALALIGPTLAPHSPTEFVDAPFVGPSRAAPLGTDYLGHDVVSRLLFGGRTVIWMSVAAALMSVAFGAALGMVAAYSGGRIDMLIMRSTDALLAIPSIILVLLFVSMAGPELWLIVLLVAVAWTPQVARVAHGITRQVASREFVEAAEVLGVPRRRILVREVLPNLMTPLLVELGLRLTWSIGVIAGISFIGFGIQPPTADWGLMINENRGGLSVQPWSVAAPVVLIAAYAIGTNLVTEALARTMSGVSRP